MLEYPDEEGKKEFLTEIERNIENLMFDVKNCLLLTIRKCWIGQRLVERLYMLSPRIERIGGGRIYSSRASVVGGVELVVLTTNLGNQEGHQN